MRPRQTTSEQDEPTVDLTPMLDIVFIMLIFFIVTATFIREPGTDVDRPESTVAQDLRSIAVLVAIDAESKVWIDGEEVEIEAARSSIESLRQENLKGAVVIQVDQKADTGVLVQVMDAAKAAGANSVKVATRNQ